MAEPPETLPGTLSGGATLPGVGEPSDVATAPGITGRTVIATSTTQQADQPSQTIGRFRIERQLGAGAMGVVLLAHDPDLARPVAIKLLRSEGEDARARLRREAQAVAKIQHPNVIAVHEVGTQGDQVYVVMEFVDGGTLRDWAKQQKRSWQQVLAVYRQAGQGLIAAHRAGLVHRDFKPDNVLIGRDGRVRVTDFGIVGVAGAALASTLQNTEAPLDEVSARLTQTGAIIGTPAYMPPEQYESGMADARSDQFAFCVSLYEALFGVRPHEGDTVGALLYSVQSGKVRATPSTDVPATIVEAIMQGLRPNPVHRHPSMQTLLRKLEPKAAAPKWPWAVAAAGLLTVGGGVLALYVPRDAPAPEPTAEAAADTFECPDAQAQFEAVWNDERRAQLKTAFEALGPVETRAFVGVAKALDARAAAWTWASDAACAARKSGDDEVATYDAKSACLEDALRATDVFVELQAEGKRESADAALSSVTMLPRTEDCEDPAILAARVRPTDEQRERLDELDKQLLFARSVLLGGDHHRAYELATALDEEARAIGFDATTAAVLETRARAEMQLTKFDDAEAHAREATELAAKSGDVSVEMRSFGTLIFVVGSGLRRSAEALGMLRTGRDVFARCTDPRARSYFKAAEGSVLVQNGDLDGAMEAANAAIEILEAVDPIPPDELAHAYSNRAGLHVARGDPEAARADQRTGLKIAKEGLGTRHALYGSIAMSLGISLTNAGEHEASLQWHREALEAWDASLGGNHPNGAMALNYIGIAQMMLERNDEAAESFEDALSRLDASGKEDPMTRMSLLQNLAHLAFLRGDFDSAEKRYSEAAALSRETMGPDDATAAMLDQWAASMLSAKGDDAGAVKGFRSAKEALVRIHGPKQQTIAQAAAFLGDALQRLGRCQEATREYSEVFRIYNDLALKPDVTLLQAVTGQGVCELMLEKPDAAEASLARAAEMLAQLELKGEAEAMVQFAGAKGHLSAGDRQTADTLSAAAEATYRRLGPGWGAILEDVREWRSKSGF